MKLVLDAIEDKVRNLLLQYSREFAKSGNPEVTLRFTGGWVRDKLLNRISHDIDVAIDKSTGEDFATGLHNYMVDMGIEETGVHKIAVNPEKSKHLETATTRICGLDVDFVNLRSEEYANSDSRVPSSISFGTPREDAFRRDATLNALFYNLTTDLVEDFTGRGLDDLKMGILRTPLDPLETFNDDPLRVLRLLRFVGQLGFTVAPETLEAMHADKVGSKLLSKVSSERMGTELLKLVESDHAANGLQYLLNLGLGSYVFRVPGTGCGTTPTTSSGTDASKLCCNTDTLLARFHSLEDAQKSASELMPTSPNERGMLYLATLVQDLPIDAVSEIIQNGLKLTRNAKDGCVRLVKSAEAFDALRTLVVNETATRSDLGNFVRKFGPQYRLCLAFNAARLEYRGESVKDALAVDELITREKVENAHELKPMLAGKQIMALTQRKPGPWLQPLLKQEVDYQLSHPEATVDDVKEYLLSVL